MALILRLCFRLGRSKLAFDCALNLVDLNFPRRGDRQDELGILDSN